MSNGSNEFDFGSGNVALAVDVDFPSNVYAGPGIAISKTGAAWTVSLGYPPLSENIHVTPTNNYYLAVYDVAQALYEKVRLDNLISGATGLDTRTPMGDADYIALSTDRYIAIATPLTLNRTISLPPASSVPGGREVVIQDEIGTLGSNHALIVQPIGGDRIDGYSSRVIATPYGGIKLRSNGSNSWSFIATTSLTPVNDTNYTCNSDDKVIAITALTAARTVTLPLAAGYAPGQRLTVMDQAGVCTASNTITVLPIGGDFINGLTASPALNAAHAFLGFVSNGAHAWTVVDNVGGGGGSGSITASQITDASALGRLLLTQTTAAQDRTSLGSGTTGDAMFLSNSPSAGRAVLGSGACGDNVFISVTQPAAQSALGLGTMATQNANNVNITGGTITGVTGIGGGSSITISDTAPGSPSAGALWFDSVGGQLYVWYNDGTSSQWVPSSNQNLSGIYLPLTGGTISGGVTISGATSVSTLNASGAITPSQTAGIVGTTAANNANAGAVGEYVVVTQSTTVPLTSLITANVTSISLTAGDWDVEGTVGLFNQSGGSVNNLVSYFAAAISLVSATLPASPGSAYASGQSYLQMPATAANILASTMPTGPLRVSVAATTTVYLVTQTYIIGGVYAAQGQIRARRVR